MLRELFDGSTDQSAFILNRGDPGFLAQLDALSAEVASARPMPGLTTVAAHVDHVLFALSLLNRWAGGEANPFAGADWSASWKRTHVDEPAWRDLLKRFRTEVATWQEHVKQPREYDDLTASGTLASIAHAAYHLGAIRQILAAQNQNHAPK
ncbi:MAG: hypothetical protein QM770_00205 [Tepidisphaeraceae bacterium]